MSTLNSAMPTPQYNPYLEDSSSNANAAGAYFPQQTAFTSPAQPVSLQQSQTISFHIDDSSYNTIYMLPTALTRVISYHTRD